MTCSNTRGKGMGLSGVTVGVSMLSLMVASGDKAVPYEAPAGETGVQADGLGWLVNRLGVLVKEAGVGKKPGGLVVVMALTLGEGIATLGGAEGGVFLAAGHGPWGISQSLGTGKVMAEMVEGTELSAKIGMLGMQ